LPISPSGSSGRWGRSARRAFWTPSSADEVSAEQAHELIQFDDQVGKEDTALVEAVQRGVRPGLIERGRLLLDSEKLVNSFEKRLFAELS